MSEMFIHLVSAYAFDLMVSIPRDGTWYRPPLDEASRSGLARVARFVCVDHGVEPKRELLHGHVHGTGPAPVRVSRLPPVFLNSRSPKVWLCSVWV